MSESVLIGLAAITFFAISVQWLAWRLKVPSILILLGAGLLVGPFFHLIDPDRPLAILLATWKSDLNVREKTFLAFLAPRGIVAAAVASLFSFTLVAAGYGDAQRLIPLTFFIII